MSGAWTFEYGCGACGGRCEIVAHGSPGTWRTTAVAGCVDCGAEWLLTVEATAISGQRGPRRPAECGTDSGYYRHRRQLKDEPCDDCRRAHAEATRVGKNLRKDLTGV